MYKYSLDIVISSLKEVLDNFKKKNICNNPNKIIENVKVAAAPKISKLLINMNPKNICKIKGTIDNFITKSALPEPVK